MSLRTSEPRIRHLIDAVAYAYRLPSLTYKAHTYSPGELLEGMVITESSGNPLARRYEPHLDKSGRTDSPTDGDRPNVDDGATEDDASWGVLQVLGANWRHRVGAPPKTPLRFEALFDWGLGLLAGVLHFRDELIRLERAGVEGDERVVRALAKYNGGTTGDAIVGGDIRRRVYVDKVAQNAGLAQYDRRTKAWKEMPA